ncbi:hypothetical protein BJX76DRAFT_46915 [Aspergillus varians]
MSTAAASARASSELHSSLRDLHIGEKTCPITDIARPKLTTSSTNTTTPSKKKKAPVVADSWEDELDESSEPEAQGELEDLGPTSSSSSTVPSSDNSMGTSLAIAEGPLDPPPTPISPQISQPWVSAASGGYGLTSRSTSTSSSSDTPRSRATSASTAREQGRRPEKQTAVAGRLIAGALGIRAPKRTEEQRAYDRAVREQEMRRRNKEREEAARLKEEEEKAKLAVWDA